MIKLAVKSRLIFVFFLLLASTLYAQDLQEGAGAEELLWPEEEEFMVDESQEEMVAQEPQEGVGLPEETTQESMMETQAPAEASQPQEEAAAMPADTAAKPQPKEPVATQTAVIDNLVEAQKVTLDFKEADIRNVLKIISYKAGVNIIATPEVMGDVSIRLVDVHWEKALGAILKTYGFAYEKQGNILLVAPIEKLTAMKKQEVELQQVQPTMTEVFNLKYLDASDAKKALEPQLSKRGKITILEMTGQAGWEFGTAEMAKRKRTAKEQMARSKVLIISDISPALDKIKEVIREIDVKPVQVLIQARLMEVSKDKLKDIGFDWGSGADSATTGIITTIPTGRSDTDVGAVNLGGLNITPAVFGPRSTGLSPTNAGLRVLFEKLSGTEFEVLLHALEEDIDTNTLSAPNILTLSNQEATILVGTKYPILKSEVSTESSQVVSVDLDYYQDIGIQLNVVPQVGANDSINMVVHPAVSTITTTDASINSARYPVIEIREAETRVLMQDGETVVIGGLIRDVVNKGTVGIPFLRHLPLIGGIFRRDTYDTAKVELLIFITAKIVREQLTPEEITALEGKFNRAPVKEKAVVEKKKKGR
jgi:type IV pilus assembly protein PilQ